MWHHLLLLLPVVGVVLFVVLPWSAALPAYAALAVLSAVMFVAGLRALRLPVKTGTEGMVGRAARVVEPLRPGDRRPDRGARAPGDRQHRYARGRTDRDGCLPPESWRGTQRGFLLLLRLAAGDPRGGGLVSARCCGGSDHVRYCPVPRDPEAIRDRKQLADLMGDDREHDGHHPG